MLSANGSEVAGRQLSAISHQHAESRGHGHLEIVTCDSQSRGGSLRNGRNGGQSRLAGRKFITTHRSQPPKTCGPLRPPPQGLCTGQ